MALSMRDIDNQIETRPLTKEHAKQQFIEKTQELNIQHAFKFDEAWDFVEYKRKQQKFRETVIKFEKAINNHESSLGNELHELNPTKHSKTHPFFLMKGEMSIITEEGSERIKAPYQGITKAGTKRVIYTHSECVFITVHRTDNLSVTDIENEVIASSFDEVNLTVPDTLEIKRLIKELS